MDSRKLRLLEELLEAVDELIDNAPIGGNDQPYVDEIIQGEFEDLVRARKKYYEAPGKLSSKRMK